MTNQKATTEHQLVIPRLAVPRHRQSFIGTVGSLTRSVTQSLRGPKRTALGLFVVLLGTTLGLSKGGDWFTQSPQSTDTDAANAQVATAPLIGDAPTGKHQPVTVQSARLANVESTLSLTGTLVPESLLRIAPALSGVKVTEMRVKPGDRVSAGQVIAVLDNSLLLAQLAQAEAQLSQAETAVQRQSAALVQAEGLEQAATSEVGRYSMLYEQGAISQQQLSDRQINTFTAQQQVAVAAATLSSAQANIDNQLAEIAKVDTQLSQTVVVAPVSGTIAEKLATVGEVASSSSPVYSLIENSSLILELKPSQAQLAKIELGMPVSIRTSAANSQPILTGSVLSIDPTLQSNSRQATVKVALPADAGQQLKAGMFLQAGIITSQQKSVVVPSTAVVTQPDGQSIVYTIDSSNDGITTVQTNAVEVAARSTTVDSNQLNDNISYVNILSGLSANSAVVVSGASYLQNGDRVTVLTDSSAVDLVPGGD